MTEFASGHDAYSLSSKATTAELCMPVWQLTQPIKQAKVTQSQRWSPSNGNGHAFLCCTQFVSSTPGCRCVTSQRPSSCLGCYCVMPCCSVLWLPAPSQTSIARYRGQSEICAAASPFPVTCTPHRQHQRDDDLSLRHGHMWQAVTGVHMAVTRRCTLVVNACHEGDALSVNESRAAGDIHHRVAPLLCIVRIP